MKKEQLDNHHTVSNMIKNLGIDDTYNYLKKELSDTTKEVIYLREKIEKLERKALETKNSDNLIHIKYDIEKSRNLLNSLLKKLKLADERYIYFQKLLVDLKIS